MERLFLYGLDAAAAWLLQLSPALLVAGGGLTWRRRRAGWPLRAAAASAARDVLLALSVLAILFLTLMPTGDTRTLDPVPFARIWRHLSQGLPAPNDFIGGNVVLFVPFGFLLAWRLAGRLTMLRVTLLAAALSATVEGLQFALAIGRQTLADDVILNTLGGALGAGGWKVLTTLSRRSHREAAAGSGPVPRSAATRPR